MMSEKVKPALTPEDQRNVHRLFEHLPLKYDAPFGFWPELPTTLRSAAEHLRVLTKATDPEAWIDLEVAADRIEDLLPPGGG
jgi:hypothetical protein